jgi:hypothetical protein
VVRAIRVSRPSLHMVVMQYIQVESEGLACKTKPDLNSFRSLTGNSWSLTTIA